MNKSDVEKILRKAEQMCIESGNRFTEKRRKILSLLVQSSIPLSAYEIADAYNKSESAKMPAMSVYRILEFFESESLAHKLNSNNKYVACSHIQCSHNHRVPQFLICEKCQKVKEISIAKEVFDQLDKQVSDAGFKITDSHIELQCVCEACKVA